MTDEGPDDEIEVEAVDHHDDYLEGHAEIRLRGPRMGLLPVLHCISAGMVLLSRSENPGRRLFALVGEDVLNQFKEQGWAEDAIEERVDSPIQEFDTREIPGMVDVEVIDEELDDDG